MTVPTLDQLEFALTSFLRPHRIKVARLVAVATRNLADFGGMEEEHLNELVNEALARVITHDDVCVHGDVKNWRHSEIHLKQFQV